MKIQYLLLIFVSAFYKANAQTVTIDSIYKTSKIDTVVFTKFTRSQAYESILKYFRSRPDGTSDLRYLTSQDPLDGKITFTGHIAKNIIKHLRPKDKDTIELVALNYKGTVYIKDQKYKIILNSLVYQYGFKSAIDIPDYALKNGIDWTPLSASNDENKENTLCKELAKSLIVDIARKTNISSDSDF
ncbi:hypothetical protein ACFS5N_16480 [Mucilaginibacter ximonensis]|uniref:DUF4468 domain-containing protein n=1 Tax=Mucilaginibacter ximonensis TaxID=538021 RepID=A0ABW5YH12_9SPHI